MAKFSGNDIQFQSESLSKFRKNFREMQLNYRFADAVQNCESQSTSSPSAP